MPTNTYTTTATKSSNKRDSLLKTSLRKGDLFKGIQTVQSAISVRSTLPVLGNILFESHNDGLRLSATDLEVGIRTQVKADVVQEGAITIPAKILADFLKTLEDDRELKIEVTENFKVEVRSGRDRLSITGLPKSDYPVLPEFQEKAAVSISGTVLKELIKKTIFAASSDETRYVLNGIHFVAENGKVMAVSTDGRRLAFIQREISNKKLKVKIIIPTKAIQELLRLVSDEKSEEETTINASFTDNQASFSAGNTIILSRLIEGSFPNYEQVIPKSHSIQLKLERAALLASVTRAAVGTLERGGSIRVILTKGTMKIQATAQGRVEVESELPVNYEGSTFEIAFNPLYMMDALKALSQPEVFIELTSPLNPGVLRPTDDDNYRYIMMPMKV